MSHGRIQIPILTVGSTCYENAGTFIFSQISVKCQYSWRISNVGTDTDVFIILLYTKTVLIKKRCSAWHKNTNILLFFLKIVILGFYAGKSHNLIGLGIFNEDLDFFDLRIVPRYTRDNLEIKKVLISMKVPLPIKL
jgi:hypothetical protein